MIAWRGPNLWTVLAAGQLLLSVDSYVAYAADKGQAPALSPIYRLKVTEGEQRLATKAQVDLQKLPIERIAFYAVVTNEWLAGLAPIFAVERTNRMELRRRPPRGQENFSEPFFFGLPLEDELEAAKLIGRWDCRATREGSKPYVGIELTIEGERISGRFDQNTDYRFAFITGGTFKSNQLELRIEYIKDAYSMIGQWNDGVFKGSWRRTDDAEKGTWEASRPSRPTLSSKETVALYEWRRRQDDAHHYAVEGERMSSGWERGPRPLCRVWKLAK